MSKRIFSAIMMPLLVLGTLALAFNVQPVRASGTIYIRADGGIDPPTAQISSIDNVTYIFTDNIINESIVVERDNIVIDGAGYTVQGTGTEKGIDLSGRINVTVRNTQIKTCYHGIYLSGSFYNSISGNNVTANSFYGIFLDFSSGNSVSGNNVANNAIGINLYSSLNNSVSGNYVTANNDEGIEVGSSSNNSVSGNNVAANNGNGFSLDFSSNNSVSGNNVTANDWYGIVLGSSSNNKFCHNNFVDNAHQVYSYNSTNIWDDGYPSGGNYWSDYNGTDLYSGPSQNVTGSDGLGDSPYVIDANNKDSYPLMKAFPWSEHDIGITYIGRVYTFDLSVVPLKTIVSLRFSLNISTFVLNYGNQTETFNVQVYANDTVVGTFANVTLAGRQSAILTLRWNTTGLAYGNYTIKAVAVNLTEETDVSDNVYTDGIVYVGIPGDINGDGKVDMLDIAFVARRFGTNPRSSIWDPNADLNDDGKIDMFDIGYAARHFGETFVE